MNKSTIIITGVSSFIGFHLAKHYSNTGVSVIGTISKPISDYDGIRAERLNELQRQNVSFEVLDLLDSTKIIDLIKAHKPQVWYHHAAWTQNYGSMEYDLLQAFEVNMQNMDIIYQQLKENGAKGIVLTGSNAEYSNNDNSAKETDFTSPITPYGLAKLTTTLRSYQLAHQFQLPTRVIRVFNPYGAYDAPKKLIPYIIEGLSNNTEIDLSACFQKRDFLFIDDLIVGFDLVTQHLSDPELFEIFNLCSGEATSLKEFLLLIAEGLNADSTLLNFGAKPMRPGEPEISYGSNEKAKTILNWKPRSLREGIKNYLASMESVNSK